MIEPKLIFENKEAERGIEERRGSVERRRETEEKKKNKEDGLVVRDKSFAPGLSGP